MMKTVLLIKVFIYIIKFFLKSAISLFSQTGHWWLGFSKYFRDLYIFARSDNNEAPLKIFPFFTDYTKESTSSLSEYFWQDLFIAKYIINKGFVSVLDIGSRVDGFIGNISLFQSIDVVDIRPLPYEIPNVNFIQADFSSSLRLPSNYDCISCLHTIEHIGLGRFNDPIDPDGWKKLIKNISSHLKHNGIAIISVPVGIESVHFNAHRIFNPHTFCNACLSCGLKPYEFYISSSSYPNKKYVDINSFVDATSSAQYNLAIFILSKIE